MENLLKIRDLHVEYHTEDDVVRAVNGLNLDLYKGETLGLVGETGAGKTTTALSVMNLLPDRLGFITKGEIQLGDLDVLHASPSQLREMRGAEVSMIFQDPMTSLNPTLTIGEQIAEVLEIHAKEDKGDSASGRNPGKSGKSMRADQIGRRVDEILELVGLPPARKNEYPHQFSGGMKQRVVIAMALACEPRLLLADEPTTALDVTIQAQVLEMMRRLKEELGTAMLLITHDLGVVAETCDRVAIMYAGEIIEIGSVEDIFKGEGNHPYTEGLFGSIPDMTKSERRLHPIDGLMPDPTQLPEGCPFAPRCGKAADQCRSRKPAEVLHGTHMVKCHLWK